ncbi:hypothetical protein EC957_004438 [Mortierella hygrophila]|uniref:Uncharacterized protein n=1 Tax=Mortierella hygrophila TaxID=979708 RepID=A0A9P6F2A4_9FUNG|nr:hypothetical protein EC957_004438 [Mortierella hygrophila]
MTQEAIKSPGRHRYRLSQAQGENSVLATHIQEKDDERQDDAARPEDNTSGEPESAESVVEAVHKVNGRGVDVSRSQPQTLSKARTDNRIRTRYTPFMKLPVPPAKANLSTVPTRKRRLPPKEITKELPTKRRRGNGPKEKKEDTEQDHHLEWDQDEEKYMDVRTLEEACRPSTQIHYKRSQAIFMKWCKRERFEDGHKVTREKYYEYMKELLFPPSIDGSDAHPIGVVSRPVAYAHKSALRYLYISQCLADGVVPNFKGVLHDERIEGLIKEYQARLEKVGRSSTSRSTVGLTKRMTSGQAVTGSTSIEMEKEKDPEQDEGKEKDPEQDGVKEKRSIAAALKKPWKIRKQQDNTPDLSQQIQTIQTTLASMTQFMQTFRDETKAAIGICVEHSKSAEESVGKLQGRITRMERSIQGLWSKLDDYGMSFVEQAMDDMETRHRRQGEQLRTMRRLVEHHNSMKEIDQELPEDACQEVDYDQEKFDQEVDHDQEKFDQEV